MSVNYNYNYNCLSTSRNCVSGCCNSLGGCSLIYSTCYYKYTDFSTNQSYYFPNAYNMACSSNALNCKSGCCKYAGSCATNSSNCYWRYTDFYTNPTYTYTYSVYNANCATNSQNCSSGCCQYSGACATSMSNCAYRYSDYSTNLNYTYSFNPYYNVYCVSSARNCQSGCCDMDGYCASSSNTCYYRYGDFSSNSNYYYSSILQKLPCYTSHLIGGKPCQPEKSFFELNQWILIGSYIGYIFLFFMIAIACYCARKSWVQSTNAFGDVNAQNSQTHMDQTINNQTYRGPVIGSANTIPGGNMVFENQGTYMNGGSLPAVRQNVVHPFNDASLQELRPGMNGFSEERLSY